MDNKIKNYSPVSKTSASVVPGLIDTAFEKVLSKLENRPILRKPPSRFKCRSKMKRKSSGALSCYLGIQNLKHFSSFEQWIDSSIETRWSDNDRHRPIIGATCKVGKISPSIARDETL